MVAGKARKTDETDEMATESKSKANETNMKIRLQI